MTRNKIYSFFNKPVFKHVVFWCVIFIYYMSTQWPYEKNKFLLTQAVFFDFILQIILARVIIDIYLPNLLHKNKKFLFFCSTFFSIYIAYVIYTSYRCFYLAEVFKEDYSHRPPLIFIDRILDFPPFLRSLPAYMAPTVMLIVFNYYKQQKKTAILLEQKKSNELDALRNQLNPHFLFNTLNNLYSLALKKSDSTPEVIAKLSDILDYILYRCKSKLVPLKNEIELLHNYISLEKIRYGKRVHINFTETIENNTKIAPLLLLTFLENAFKHGVNQEIKTATIDINISSNSNQIEFYLKNSKPQPHIYRTDNSENREAIGLINTTKQLDLLYPNKYKLDINDTEKTYTVTLKIILNEL